MAGSDDWLHVENLDDVAKALQRYRDKEIDKAMRAANRAAARAVVPIAREEAPKVSGKLAKSIRASATAKAGVLKAGNADVPYAGPIHWGWFKRHIRANKFLVRAVDKAQGVIRRSYEHEIDRANGRV